MGRSDWDPQNPEFRFLVLRRALFILYLVLIVCVGNLVFLLVSITHRPAARSPGFVSRTPTEKTESRPSDRLVWVAPHSGRKYHCEGCYHLECVANAKTMTIDEARRAGFEPCKACMPNAKQTGVRAGSGILED